MCYEEIKKAFNTLSPNTSFWIGFVMAILVLGTLGFAVLLSSVVSGKVNLSAKAAVVQSAKSAAVNKEPALNNNDLTEPAGEVTPISSRDHVRGEANAKITLIGYTDFECSFCHKFHETVKQVMAAYPGKVKWALRHFPLDFHPNAQKMAEASECAYELGGHDKFWQYADKLFVGKGLTVADLPRLAGEIGLDKAKFSNCLDSGKYADYVKQSAGQGQAAGVRGTPGTIIISAKGEKNLIKGALPLEMMKDLINKAL